MKKLLLSVVIAASIVKSASAQSQDVYKYKIDKFVRQTNQLIQNVSYSCRGNETIISMASGKDPYGSKQACAEFQKKLSAICGKNQSGTR